MKLKSISPKIRLNRFPKLSSEENNRKLTIKVTGKAIISPPRAYFTFLSLDLSFTPYFREPKISPKKLNGTKTDFMKSLENVLRILFNLFSDA